MLDRVLITGASGLLGAALGQKLFSSGVTVLGIRKTHPRSLPHPDAVFDLLDSSTLQQTVMEFKPDVIVHAAALSKVLACERDPELAHRMNVGVTERLTNTAKHLGSYFIFVSTDQVFDGHRGYFSETDIPAPTHVYGKTKHEAEQVVKSSTLPSLVLRSNNIVGANRGWGTSFTDGLLRRLLGGEKVELFDDQYRSPVHLASIVDTIVSCIRRRLTGTLHVGGPERLSRFATGCALARAYGISDTQLKPVSMSSHPEAKTLHVDGSFDTTRFRSLLPEQGNFFISTGFQIDKSDRLQ